MGGLVEVPRPGHGTSGRLADDNPAWPEDRRRMTERVHRPRWTCRLHLWHRWRTYRDHEGGGQFQECLDCGKIRDVPTVRPIG